MSGKMDSLKASYAPMNCEVLHIGVKTNHDIVRDMDAEELADLIFYELAQFPDRASLLAWLEQEAGT